MPRKADQDREVRRRIALILTALPDEFRAIVKHLKKLGDGKAFDSIGTHYFVGTYGYFLASSRFPPQNTA